MFGLQLMKWRHQLKCHSCKANGSVLPVTQIRRSKSGCSAAIPATVVTVSIVTFERGRGPFGAASEVNALPRATNGLCLAHQLKVRFSRDGTSIQEQVANFLRRPCPPLAAALPLGNA